MTDDDKPLSAQASAILTSLVAGEFNTIILDTCDEKYRRKNDLSFYDKRELEVVSTNKYQIDYNDKYPNSNDSAKIAKIKYNENAKLIGKYIYDNVEYEFDINFKSDDNVEDNHFMLLNTETNIWLIWSESTTELVLTSANDPILFDLIIESAYIENNDKIALKSELPEPVDLSNYALKSEIRAYNDLSYCSTNKTILTVGKMAYNGAPKILPFNEGAHIKFNATFADYTETFDFIFKTTSISEDVHTMMYNINGHEYAITWEDNNFGEFNVKLNNVTTPTSYNNMIADI
ncbi:hypothetical protein M9Y10_013846, partial [Tritrichomonas musculus]